MMSRSGRYVVGEYVVGKQIGSGSFSTVWHARHRVHGTEVAIKEIAMARLNNKLQESLKSEIVILKKINHPNIIRLHDMIEKIKAVKRISATLESYNANGISGKEMESGKIYIILEYCKGGDLSMYIQQRQGRIPEATAKHFMQQLASGLKILRENNLIHRDLKPQNLLLSTNDESSILKIADFGFARSLQPRGLAETLCGSPLYMAPEIMQLQKYDAKADLWSVGAILFQLVTGRTPFTGNNQIQLLQNIVKSTDLQFPPDIKDLSPECIDLCRKLLRRNPVERLTFEEFFNHPFLSQKQPDDIFRNRRSQRVIDGFPISEYNPVRNTEENSQEDCLPFSLDDDSSGPGVSPSFVRRSPLRTTYGFSLDAKADRREIFSTTHKPEAVGFGLGSRRLSEGNLKESFKSMDHKPLNIRPKEVDSLELIDQDYVLVSGPPVDSSSSASASKLSSFPSKPGSPPLPSVSITSTPSAPLPIIGATTSKVGSVGNLESHSFAPRTLQGSLDILDNLEEPSINCMTRIKSLKRCASVISALLKEKTEEKRHLEAFSIQLVILAIWKQALDICHTQSASAIEGSLTEDTPELREIIKEQATPDIQESHETADILVPADICSEIESAFLLEVENAEELAKAIEPGSTEMPDAMETIYQAAIDLGKHGAVKEYMGDVEIAEVCYSKAVSLFVFIRVEAPSLNLNPPFSLTTSDHSRLQSYIDLLTNRQSISRSQRMALLKCGDQQCTA